jgi:hypothetical protein
LLLKSIEKFLHFLTQTYLILRRSLPLCRQFYIDSINGYSFFEVNAINLAKIESSTLVVGNVVDDGLLNAHVGDFFEIDQDLVGHVLQSHSL